MRRTATRLLTAAIVMLTLVAGAQPAHAAAPAGLDGTSGFLCKLIKFSCP